nr:MerR family DNA-binding transcriptional regulator [Cylindrospermopsis raciborskii]
MEDSQMTISIGDTAKELGVSVKTVRRWADSGKLRFERSPSGPRRFYLADIKRITPRDFNQLEDRVTINYARVSSSDQTISRKRCSVKHLVWLVMLTIGETLTSRKC